MDLRLGKKIEQKSSNKALFLHTFLKSVFPGVVLISFKKRFINRMFWGRGAFHRQVSHIIFISLTALMLFSGVVFEISENSVNSSFSTAGSNPGDKDLLEQGADIQSILLAETTKNFKVLQYTIQSGDTVDSISTKFNISKETIRGSNLDVIDYHSEAMDAGDQLLIPEINGVIIPVSEGDTIDTVISKIRQGNRKDIEEINNLKSPDFSLAGLTYVFVPDGEIIPPPKPIPDPVYIYASSDVVFGQNANVEALNGIAFSDPLASCPGYSWSRGVSSWHNGVDLPGTYGCEIRAIASGTVVFSGWEPYGGGFAVTIDHGNGVQSVYYHNSSLVHGVGTFVNQGQVIGYMGCTGYCTGTHLHLGLRINYVYIDPAPYVPFFRPY